MHTLRPTPPIEVVWLLMSLWSSVSAAAAFQDARRDIRAVRALRHYRADGPRALILAQSHRAALCRLLVQGTFTLVGLASWLAPVPALRYNRYLRSGSAVCFILAEGIMTWEAISERITRRQVNRLLQRRPLKGAPNDT